MAKKTLTASTVATDNIQNQPDIVEDQATALKLAFDQYGIDDKNYTNSTLIAELQASTTDNSGANRIGFGGAEYSADNVEDALNEVRTLAQDAKITSVDDNSITNAKLATDIKVGSLASLTTSENTSVVGAINELDADIDNAFNADLAAYEGNTKLADDGQDVSEWTAIVGTLSQDTTNVKIGSGSIRITEPDNTAGSLSAKKDGISLDLSVLNNGETSPDTDYIYLVYYCSDATKVGDILYYFSQDATWTASNNKIITISSHVTGWNYKKIKKNGTEVSTTGTGAWSGVQSMRMLWNSLANAQNEYVSFQLTQLIKKDPLADYPNPFQRNGVRDFAINSGEWFVGEEFDKTIIRELSDSGSITQILTYNNFNSFCLQEMYDNNRSDRFSVYFNSANYIAVYPRDGKLRIQTAIGGSVSDNDNLIFATDVGHQFTISIDKEGADILVKAVNLTTNTEVQSKLNIPSFESLNFSITLAANGAGFKSTFLAMSITQLYHAHTSDIATVAKSLTLQGAKDAGALTPKQPGGGLLINGNFDIWQRGTSFSSPGYNADRWLIGATKTVTRVANTAPNNAKYALKIDMSTPATVALQQRIENPNNVLLNQKSVLSFWAKGTVATQCTTRLARGGVGALQDVNYNVTTSWQEFVVPFNAFGTWLTDEYIELQLLRSNTIGSIIEFSQVKLEIGDTATDFVSKTYAEELRDCQRYYERVEAGATLNGIANGHAQSATQFRVLLPFKTKRSVPSTSYSDFSEFTVAAGSGIKSVSGVASAVMGIDKGVFTVTVTGATLGEGGYLRGANPTTYIALDAEL